MSFRGHKHTKEWKEKLRKRMIGNTFGFKKGHHASIKTEFEKGVHPKTEWKKGQHYSIDTEFKNGHKIRLGKHWKVKDTTKYHQPKSEQHRQNTRLGKILHPNRKFSNTKIEQKIATELEKRGLVRNVDFYQNKGLENIANVDFYLPRYNVIIECDGCFYHNCLEHYPKHHKDTRKTDKLKTKNLIKAGFKVYRFWEHEINESSERCIDKILNQIR